MSQVTTNNNFSNLLLTGNLKDVALTYIGFIFFNDSTLTNMMLIGLTLSFIGSLIYVVDSINK